MQLLDNTDTHTDTDTLPTNEKPFHPESVLCFLLFLSIYVNVWKCTTLRRAARLSEISYNVHLFKATKQMEGLWARLVKVKPNDCNSCTFNRIPRNLKHYPPRNKLFYKIMLLRKQTVCPDFAEGTEDFRTAFYCSELSSQITVQGKTVQGCQALWSPKTKLTGIG